MAQNTGGINSRVSARNVENSTIIGVKQGLDEEAINRLFTESKQELREYITAAAEAAARTVIEISRDVATSRQSQSTEDEWLPAVASPLVAQSRPLAISLYVCSSSKGMRTLGFAINNSGLLVTSAVVDGSISAKNLASGRESTALVISKDSLLQLLRIPAPTVGITPAYLTAWGGDRSQIETAWDEPLYAMDDEGVRQTLRVSVVAFSGEVHGYGPRGSVDLDGLIGCERKAGQRPLSGGPVFTSHDEVCGVVVAYAVSPKGVETVFIAPWANLDIARLTNVQVGK
jgi:hypothetical protein